MRFTPLALLLAGAFAAACSDTGLSGPAGADALDAQLQKSNGAAQAISAMSFNMYVGADLDGVLAALTDGDPSNDLDAFTAALGQLQATDFPTRAGGFADEIARERPHVVGLQEVSYFDIDLTGYGVPVDFELPFLPILQSALADRGLNYQVAAQVQNLDLQPIPGIRVVDYDVLLVDADRANVLSNFGKNFDYNAGEVAPGIDLIRGYVGAAIDVDGTTYTVVSTHPEAGGDGDPTSPLPMLRAAQITEVVTALGASERAIVMGDLNDLPGSPMYQVLQGAGFTDVWAAMHPGADGYTCCHDYDLADPNAQLYKRIDYIWERGIEQPGAGVQGRIQRVGDKKGDRVEGPEYTLWLSDHVGLSADFLMPPAIGSGN